MLNKTALLLRAWTMHNVIWSMRTITIGATFKRSQGDLWISSIVTDAGIDEVVVVSTATARNHTYRDWCIFSKSLHVLCLAHIVDLAPEVFHHYIDFKHASDMIAMIKSSIQETKSEESLPEYLNDFIASLEVKLPPVPVTTRWNSWFETAMYQATRVHLYEGFHRAEKGTVERIIELVNHKTIYPEITLQLYFIKENCQWMMTVLTAVEEKETPRHVRPTIIWRISRSIRELVVRIPSIGTEINRLMSKLPETDRKEQIKSLHHQVLFPLLWTCKHFGGPPMLFGGPSHQ